MGGLLTLSLKILEIIYAIVDKASFSWISYVISYAYLSLKKKRFPQYDFQVDGQPEKVGFFVTPEEWKLDTPQQAPDLNKNADDVFCFGVNSNSDALAVHISRQTNGQVSCSLVLRFGDGREHVLPTDHTLQAETPEEYTFGSSRLKFQCLQPMRKWRLFFNGLLRDNTSHNETIQPKYKHVSFTFIFTASSDVFDFTDEMSKSMLARYASSTNFSSFPLQTLKRVYDVFNAYEQSGMLLGTVKVDGEDEQEMYLWGNRGRYIGETRNLSSGSFIQIYGNFENGAIVHVGILNVNDEFSEFSHGFVMRSDGFIHPIETFSWETDKLVGGQYSLHFFCGGVQYKLTVTEPLVDKSFQKEFIGKSSVKFSELVLNNWTGKGFIFKGTIDNAGKSDTSESLKLDLPIKEKPLITSFSETFCQVASLTGGKGSSLGKLYCTSLEFKGLTKFSITPSVVNVAYQFDVSKGFVVTTEAYKIFIDGTLCEAIEKFQKEVWEKPEGGSKSLCEKIVERVANSKIPPRISQSVKESMKKLFSDYSKKKFAVRSSTTGEDTEQMSAAGQMETFLGLNTIDEILEAVKKCWASQFTFQAVEYKRRYGQLLNTPMAVVVQEMVPCDVAGVAFTCDPLSGNPEYVTITANYGLGESVVSASAEPDTVILKRSPNNKLKIHSQEIGKKNSKVVMTGDSGVQHVEVDTDSSICCLNDEMALKLGFIAIKLEEIFGSPRDLEWGIIGEKIFFFQARPITSLDTDTDFENKHCFDSYMRLENEYFSKANVGEVLPGATSPLGLEFLAHVFNILYERQVFVRWEGSTMPNVPYYERRFIYAYRHVFMCMLDAFMRLEDGSSETTDGFMYAVHGRNIGSEEMTDLAVERHKAFGKRKESQLVHTIFSNVIMYVSGIWNRKVGREVETFEIPVCHENSATEIFCQIANNFQICVKAIYSHMLCSISSSMWNMKMLVLLSTAKGDWGQEVYSDFAYLLSTCSQLESADVPAAVQNLGLVIAQCIDVWEFKKMDVDDALKWLQTTDTEAGKVFQRFLMKHGHRCLKEFDVMIEPWGANPKPLIKMLQNIVSPDLAKNTSKQVPNFSSILSNLQIRLNLLQRAKLYWFLLNGRRGVREREFAKSILIKSIHKVRKAFHCLAEVMVKEGYLPRKELLFFLALEEIRLLIRTRSPRLVSRALKRSKCHSELDKLIFPEQDSGIPKPINIGSNTFDVPTGSFTMKGIPVSQGVTKATARVVMNLEEAATIQQGDVLITYSTDIGWSPYFPLLSGVVTELGGLISHGAVVAREYGLPCVVGLHGATQAFKSGDLVILDGSKGTLQKIET